MKCELSYQGGIQALKKGNLSLAENIFKSLIDKNNNDLNSRFGLARVYLELKAPYKARAVFSQIVENTSNRINSNIELSKDCISNSDWSKAENMLENAISLLSPNIRARNYLKRLYYHTGEFDKREQLIKEDDLLNDLEFSSNFLIGNFTANGYSKEEALAYLNDFAKPHLPHLTNNINYYEFIRNNFEDLSFTILPNGKPSFKQLVSDDVQYRQKPQKQRTVYPEELSIANRCQYLLDKQPSRGYKGKDKFTGYLIFEYENLGVCILEKLFSKTKDNHIKESSSNATYLFPTNMTLALSQYSKSDIISMMKTQHYIQRVVHTPNYYENLDKKIKQVQIAYLEHKQNLLLNKSQFKKMDNLIDKGDFEYDDK